MLQLLVKSHGGSYSAPLTASFYMKPLIVKLSCSSRAVISLSFVLKSCTSFRIERSNIPHLHFWIVAWSNAHNTTFGVSITKDLAKIRENKRNVWYVGDPLNLEHCKSFHPVCQKHTIMFPLCVVLLSASLEIFQREQSCIYCVTMHCTF